jgi:hypothetical protein
MYRALPEFNRACVKAARDRAYQQHLSALTNMRPSVDTTRPHCPLVIGRNFKRYVNDQERNALIMRDNKRLLGKMEDIQRQEHYPIARPRRPFTLLGQAQRDEMARITHENKKLLTAVQDRPPVLNRNEWLAHHIDHEYQIQKMSEHTTTRPMGEVIKDERAKIAAPRSARSQSVAGQGQKWQFETTEKKPQPTDASEGEPEIGDVIEEAVTVGGPDDDYAK